MKEFAKKAAAFFAAGVMAFGASVSAAAKTEKAEVSYNASVAKPTYTIKGSNGYRKIKLTTKTSGATIYYTTDGSSPLTNGKVLKSGSVIKITGDRRIRAVAVKGTSKSAIMTKTVHVSTMYGDITGDGNISETDYTRLKNYISGKTSYICLDNADVNGDGVISSKDLNSLRKYIDGDISVFPAAKAVNISTPKITMYPVYGGKSAELSVSDNSAIYYTLDGTMPTNKSERYTEPIFIAEDTTLKCVAYKNGRYGNTRGKNIEVSRCGAVTADMPQDKTYDNSVDVSLRCYTKNSSIYYTTDGSDPKTSGTAKVYSKKITLTQNTTLKFYASASGVADTDVVSAYYKIADVGFTISGYVWDDNSGASKNPDGVFNKLYEKGINDINVYLYDADRKTNAASTVTKTADGTDGYYEFKGVPKGNYMVCFEYNSEKYRVCDKIVKGGNQAVGGATPNITVKNNGTYDSSGMLITSTNSYADACKSTLYKSNAYTAGTYSSDAENVGAALLSNNYGSLKLTMRSVESVVTKQGELNYIITLANNSPYSYLSDATLRVYVDSNLEDIYFRMGGAGLSYSRVGYDGNYYYYEIRGFASNLAPGATVTINMNATVGRTAISGSTISGCAEVVSYKFRDGCYDVSSIPGNMVIGTAKENDEAVSGDVTVDNSAKADVIISQDHIYITVLKGTNGEILRWGYSPYNQPYTKDDEPKISVTVRNADYGSTLVVTGSSQSHINAVPYEEYVYGAIDQYYYIVFKPTGAFTSSYISDDTIVVNSTSNPTAKKNITVTYIVTEAVG